MGKLIQTVLIALLVYICSASPARLEKLLPSKSNFLARQEVVEDMPAQTPYPPAGIRPEVPFNFPTEGEKKDEPTVDILTSGKVIAPADYYLPPIFEPAKFSAPSEVYGPPAETYGPPEVSPKDENNQVDKDDVQSEESQSDEAQPEEAQQEDALMEELQPEEVESSPKPVEEELKVEAERVQEASDEAQVSIAEESNNELLGRIVLAKKSSNKKAAKLQTLQPVSALQFFLIDGKLYGVSA